MGLRPGDELVQRGAEQDGVGARSCKKQATAGPACVERLFCTLQALSLPVKGEATSSLSVSKSKETFPEAPLGYPLKGRGTGPW